MKEVLDKLFENPTYLENLRKASIGLNLLFLEATMKQMILVLRSMICPLKILTICSSWEHFWQFFMMANLHLWALTKKQDMTHMISLLNFDTLKRQSSLSSKRANLKTTWSMTPRKPWSKPSRMNILLVFLIMNALLLEFHSLRRKCRPFSGRSFYQGKMQDARSNCRSFFEKT